LQPISSLSLSLITLLLVPPPQGFNKMNFDGASKDNPRLASYGGVFRDVKGKIIKRFDGHNISNSNNVIKL
jgi:hypothetical protein